MKPINSISILGVGCCLIQATQGKAEESTTSEEPIELVQIVQDQDARKSILSETMFEATTSNDLVVNEKPSCDSCERLISSQLSLRNISIPRELLETHQALKSILSQIEQSESPDSTDIIFLMDANGKTQSLLITKFLARLERKIQDKFSKSYPGLELALSFPVDAFVGGGSGAIPAAIAALSKGPIEDSIPILESAHSKISRPKKTCGCCCRKVAPIIRDFISAYQGEFPLIEDEDGINFDKLIVDNFDFKKAGIPQLIDIFGGYSQQDLQSTLEVIALQNEPKSSVLDLVVSAINARFWDTEKKLKYVDVAGVFENAEFILEQSANKSKPAKFLNKAIESVDKLSKLSVVSMKQEKRYGSIKELKTVLTSNSKIKRNLILVNLTAQTATENPRILSSISTVFSSKVNYVQDELKIVNFDYRFIIPSYIYEKNYSEAIDASIDSLFPNDDDTTQISSAKTATTMLIDFLKACNSKALYSIAEDDVNKRLLLPPQPVSESILLTDSFVQTDASDFLSDSTSYSDEYEYYSDSGSYYSKSNSGDSEV